MQTTLHYSLMWRA